MIRHKTRPKGSLIAAIDIGSAKIACLIAQVIDDHGTAEVIGTGLIASKGVKAGIITDLKETESTVRQAVHAAETMAARVMNGYPLRDVVMAIPSTYTYSKKSSVTLNIGGRMIKDGDLHHALLKLEETDHPEDHAIIHSIPTLYTIDGHKGVENPIDMHAESLKVDLHCVKAELSALKNVNAIAEKNHLDVDCLCIAPYAAGLSALVTDEAEMGSLVIDMGAGLTSYAVFYRGAMIHAGAIKIGGQHVTRDLAAGLNTGIQDAERLKVLYGSCSLTGSDSQATVDVPVLGESDHITMQQTPRATLVNIIRPRVEEIFEIIRGEIDVKGLDGYTGGRVILTGGGSQLVGLSDLAGVMLNKQVRIGKPHRLAGLPEMAQGPEFAKTAGLIHYACERIDEQPRLSDDRSNQPVHKRVWQWLKDNW